MINMVINIHNINKYCLQSATIVHYSRWNQRKCKLSKNANVLILIHELTVQSTKITVSS